MARIRQDFHMMLRGRGHTNDREIAILCFYEELPVRIVGTVSSSQMVRTCRLADFRKIVPKDSASLDRYECIGVHANHMDMTKLSSDQDPNYRKVLSGLHRIVRSCKQKTKNELPSEVSQSSGVQGQPDHRTDNENSPAGERDQKLLRDDERIYQPTRPVNIFSGTFHSQGGRMIQGNQFNSGGGPMSF